MIDEGTQYRLIHGDCMDALREMPDCSVDAVVTDPPAGISFMGRDWDHHKGGRDEWIAWLSSVMAECLRVIKPGGHAFVWALPRTSHWTATAIEDAGWEIRDVVVHLQSQGFPKGKDLGNGWNVALKPSSEHWILARRPFKGSVAACVQEWGTGGINIAATRVGTTRQEGRYAGTMSSIGGTQCEQNPDSSPVPIVAKSTRPDAAANSMSIAGANVEGLQADGELTTLSNTPTRADTAEPNIGMMPSANTSMSLNTGECGEKQGGKCQTDGCCTTSTKISPTTASKILNSCPEGHTGDYTTASPTSTPTAALALSTPDAGEKPTPNIKPSTQNGNGNAAPVGRWPSNVVFSHSASCKRIGERRVRSGGGLTGHNAEKNGYEGRWGNLEPRRYHVDPDGTELVEAWECTEDCPVHALDEQSGGLHSAGYLQNGGDALNPQGSVFGIGKATSSQVRYGDTGSAARFYPCFSLDPEYDVPFLYVPKAARSERNEGLEHLTPQVHPWTAHRQEAHGGKISPAQERFATQPSPNVHPTVKPIRLMRWLCRLVTPPGGIVLDPFAGSASTGVAAIMEGFRPTLIEREAEYLPIAEARLEHAARQPRQLAIELGA